MIRRMLIVAAAIVSATAGACNDVGTCPSSDSITPGASCTGEFLECAYTLPTASPACDGTTVEGGVATSCVCTKGSWACPAAVACPAPGGGDGSAGDAASAGDDAPSATMAETVGTVRAWRISS